MVPNSLQCLPHIWTEPDLMQKICDTFVESTGLKLAYKGDSMPSEAHHAFAEYDITKRLRTADKASYVERQGGCCEACGETLRPPWRGPWRGPWRSTWQGSWQAPLARLLPEPLAKHLAKHLRPHSLSRHTDDITQLKGGPG